MIRGKLEVHGRSGKNYHLSSAREIIPQAQSPPFLALFEDQVQSEGIQLKARRRINRKEVLTYRDKLVKLGLFSL